MCQRVKLKRYILGVPYNISANIYCKSRILPNTDVMQLQYRFAVISEASSIYVCLLLDLCKACDIYSSSKTLSINSLSLNMFKKSWSFSSINLLYMNGQDYLDIQYNNVNSETGQFCWAAKHASMVVLYLMIVQPMVYMY